VVAIVKETPMRLATRLARSSRAPLVIAALLMSMRVHVHAGLAADKPEVTATKQAEAWLALVDQGKYAEGWDAASKLFQGAVTRAAWAEKIAGVRDPLGKVLSRRVKSAHVATQLPGAPDGKYVVIQFATSFERKKSAVETVTPMLEADGSWRVSGYFIK
jgi:hypothetical protein